MNEHEQGTSVTELIPQYNDPYRMHRAKPAPKKSNWGGVILAISIFVTGLILIAGYMLVGHRGPFTGLDSGVKACKTIAANAKANKQSSGTSDYTKAKKPFQDSSFSDIRVAGTNLINGIQAMEDASKKDDSGFAALGGIGTLMSNWNALQTACGNHGVEVPALPLSG